MRSKVQRFVRQTTYEGRDIKRTRTRPARKQRPMRSMRGA